MKVDVMDQPGFNLVSYFVIEGSGEEVLVSPVLDSRRMFTVGSDARSQLHLDTPDVEASHAVVSRKDEDYFIQPRYKKQRVLVNGKPIDSAIKLNPDDTVQIGATILRFEQEHRRTQATAIKPIINAQAALPVTTAPASLVVSSPASLAPSVGTTIHRPKAKQEAGNSNLLAFVGILAGIGVLLVMGYNLLLGSRAVTPPVESRAVDYVYADGNISVLWFDVSDCEPCDEGRAIVRQLSDEFRGDVYLHLLNLDATTYIPLAQKYELTSVPSAVILDDEGAVFTVLTGVTDAETMRAAFQAALDESANN
jgi:thiol-disulfide isomerase/thioredoxin